MTTTTAAGRRAAPERSVLRSAPAGWALQRSKNGQSAHADSESMSSSTLDLEIWVIRSCVRNCQTSRGLRCLPRQWQRHEIHGERVHRSPLGAGWDWPCSLAVVACW